MSLLVLLVRPSFFFFFFSPFLATLTHMEFPGPGISQDLNCSCNCSNTGSLTYCARPGTEPLFQCSQEAADHFVPQWALLASLSFFFLGPRSWHMEVPRLGVELELRLLACATATAMQDPSHTFDLYHSSWRRRILNPLRRPGIESANSILVGFVFCCAAMGTPSLSLNQQCAVLITTVL